MFWSWSQAWFTPRERDFPLEKIQYWSTDLRRTANYLLELKKTELANHFYGVHYAIGPNDAKHQYDLDQGYLKMTDSGIVGLIQSLEVVIQNGSAQMGRNWEGLGVYLKQLLKHLEKIQKSN